MKVLTIYQPWASLLVHGIKKFETRSKPSSYQGTYLIHAAKKWTAEQIAICASEPFITALRELGLSNNPIDNIFPTGCIVGAAELAGCYPVQNPHAHIPEPWFDRVDGRSWETIFINETEQEYGDYSPGRYVWEFKNHRYLVDPIPYKGGQGYYRKLQADQAVLDIIQTSSSYKIHEI
ncbi:MAG: ASCH domain-containing protein [Bacteroidota bacterium]